LTFSLKNAPVTDPTAQADTLFRVVHQLLEGCALHSIQFDLTEHMAFRSSIREIDARFGQKPDYKDLLILTGEANRTIQAYNQLAERFMRELSEEKQQAVKLLSQSLLRVCHASERSAQALRQIENQLGSTSQLQDMRELRAKLSDCVAALCLEADAQEARYLGLMEQAAQSSDVVNQRDPVTGLGTLKSADSRIKEVAAAAAQGHVMAFFLKNVDVINRRFGFAAGDTVLRRFSAYLERNLKDNDQLFRWRGPCFVIVTERVLPSNAIESEANYLGLRGPEQEVEGGGKSMLIRLNAVTATFPIPKDRSSSEVASKIDQFAAEQFKMAQPAGNQSSVKTA
jgi:GGDEF domain-containing protein